jgi:hypothetical protein
MIQTLSSPFFIVNCPSFQMAHLKSSGDICPHVCLQMQYTAEMAWQLVKCLLPSTVIISGNSNRGSEPIDKTLNDPSSPSLLISSPKATFLLTFSFVYLVTAMWHAHKFPVQMRTSLIALCCPIPESLALVDLWARCTIFRQYSVSTYCNLRENEDTSAGSIVWSMSRGAGSEHHRCTNMRGEKN